MFSYLVELEPKILASAFIYTSTLCVLGKTAFYIIPVISMYLQAELKTVWILIGWLQNVICSGSAEQALKFLTC